MAKHKDIYNDIYRKITNGTFKPGDQLPTGNELCDKYGVSRITAVRAMNDLEAQGMIRKTPGKGTFVRGDRKLSIPVFHLVLPMVMDLFYDQVIRAYTRIMHYNSCIGACFLDKYYTDYTEKLVDYFLESGTRGIALMHSGIQKDIDAIERIVKKIKDVPVIIVQRELPEYDGIQLLVDEEYSGYIAAKHLLELGHKRLAFFGFREGFTSAELRYNGFLKACREAEIPESSLVSVHLEDMTMISSLKKIFFSKNPPTGVVVSSEYEAIFTYELMTSLGLKVPEQLALVTLDGDFYSLSTDVPFTSVEWPGHEIGTALAETFLELDRKPATLEKTPKIRYFKPWLRVRNSCGSETESSRNEIMRRDRQKWLPKLPIG